MSAFQSQIISIDGMHGHECIERVTHALGDVLQGIWVYDVEVGEAKVLAQSSSEKITRVAIEDQGFTVKQAVSENRLGE